MLKILLDWGWVGIGYGTSCYVGCLGVQKRRESRYRDGWGILMGLRSTSALYSPIIALPIAKFLAQCCRLQWYRFWQVQYYILWQDTHILAIGLC